MITFEDLKVKLQSSKHQYDIDKITVAYEYAEAMHEGQYRKSGEPYICHPLSVAIISSPTSLRFVSALTIRYCFDVFFMIVSFIFLGSMGR